MMVAKDGVEPPTPAFSGLNNLSDLERAEIVSPDDPVMLQLKAAILRALAQQELEAKLSRQTES